MSYSTPALVRKALVPSSDGGEPESPTHTAADLSNSQLQDAIDEADVILNGYIGGRYVTPVALVSGVTPHPIDYWSRNIAAYNATLTFRGSQDFTDQDPVARRYALTMEALQAVSSGRVTLEIPGNVSDTAAQGVSPAYNPYSGTLFCVEDFDLNPGWGSNYPWGPYWRGR